MLLLYLFLGGVVADATGSSGTDRLLASIFASTERGSEGRVKEALLDRIPAGLRSGR